MDCCVDHRNGQIPGNQWIAFSRDYNRSFSSPFDSAEFSGRNSGPTEYDALVFSYAPSLEICPILRDFKSARELSSPFSRRLLKPRNVVTTEIESVIRHLGGLESSAAAARKAGNESRADEYLNEGFGVALKAVKGWADALPKPHHLEILKQTVRLALECGEAIEARRLINEALAVDASIKFSDDWEQFRDTAAWPDVWLVAAVRRDEPDAAALDVLANRYWKPLFARCHLLTLNHEKANDLAQQAWCRLLKARQGLKPGGNFPAYLMTVATNLWRDSQRAARRAGPLSDDQIASLDQALSADDDGDAVLLDVLPDLNSLKEKERTLLKLDIDRALARLTPHLREVLIARFITGESCAEIGLRYERTEQTVSGWVREAIREVKLYFEELTPCSAQKEES